MKIQIKNAQVAGPEHPSFGLHRAWYTFGVFSSDGSVKRLMLVEAENVYAINFLESVVQVDGAVSDTCGLVSISSQEPQIRSIFLNEISYIDFVLDMVDANRWFESPFLVDIFQKSLSDVDKVVATMKMNALIRRQKRETQNKKVSQEPDTEKLSQLKSGLINLGFSKKDVKKFIESINDQTKSIRDLMAEGIGALS
jgi:hypothetical protein